MRFPSTTSCMREAAEDELGTYVFDIAPKRSKRTNVIFRAASGWTTTIFKSSRPAARPYLTSAETGSGKLFPKFTTWREQVDKSYWFPTYTHADDILHFRRATCTSVKSCVHRIQAFRLEGENHVRGTGTARPARTARATTTGPAAAEWPATRAAIKAPAGGSAQPSGHPTTQAPPASTPPPSSPPQ